jgi:hypothetical protein
MQKRKVLTLKDPELREPLTVRIEDATRLSGISRQMLYLLEKEGCIKVRRVRRPGSRKEIPLIDFYSLKEFVLGKTAKEEVV